MTRGLKRIGIAIAILLVAYCMLNYFWRWSYRNVAVITGENILRQAYADYIDRGYISNYIRGDQLVLSSNVVTIGGTQYLCFASLRNESFGDHGALFMTTNRIFIWQDSKGGAKIVDDSYRPPFFPPGF